MIEVNLLPGAKKGKRSGGKGGGGAKAIDFAALGAAISSKVKDKFLAAVIVSGLVAAGSIGFMWWSQKKAQTAYEAEQAAALEDSVKYASLLEDRMRAQAKRDSALTQLMIIRAIDEDRFIWPHFLEEVSAALPIYTWLRSVQLTGNAQGVNPAASIKTPPPVTPDPTKRQRPRADVFIPKDTVRVRIVGRTVDLSAFTRFMRSLEDSPFIEGIVMEKTELLVEGGRDITQFTIQVTYQRPDSLMIRRAPIVLNQR
jgi:Tfp pilus assembly protein PilN